MKRRRSAGVHCWFGGAGTAVPCSDTCGHHGSPSLPGPACAPQPSQGPASHGAGKGFSLSHSGALLCSALQGVLPHLLLPACGSVSACFPPASTAVLLSVLQLHPIHRGLFPSCSFHQCCLQCGDAWELPPALCLHGGS